MKRIKKLKIKNCKIKFKNHPCFMYDFDKVGLTEKQLKDSFEGATLIVYKNDKLKMSKALKKCMYCGIKSDNLKKHLRKKHDVKPSQIVLAKFQLEIYKEFLDLQRKNDTVFAFAFTNDVCQQCINPNVEGREGLCSIPESARNKVRSLKMIGFNCKGFKPRWFESNKYGYIIIKGGSEGMRSIPNR